MRKYKKGEQIKSIDEIINSDCELFYIFGDNPKHIGFIQSLQVFTLLRQIKRGLVYKAVKIEKEDEKDLRKGETNV